VKPEQIDIHEQFGVKVFYGDGTRVDLLHRAGADEADAIVFCIDDRNFGAEQVKAIRQSFPKAKILVRVYDRRQLLDMKGLGVVGMKRELFESAIYLSKQALQALDVDETTIEEADREFRDRDCERLELQMKADGDMFAGSELRFSPENPVPGKD